jgi:hypothetical protein
MALDLALKNRNKATDKARKTSAATISKISCVVSLSMCSQSCLMSSSVSLMGRVIKV